jgi:rSAM/selenodomain-associated transferase 2
MRAPISVVIPTLNAEAGLAATLASLGEGLAEGLIREVVVSDGGSGDGTLALAETAGALILHGPAGRGAQLAGGAGAAQGAWLLFLHADTRLLPGWAAAARAHLATGKAGWFRLEFDAGGPMPRIAERWANLRAAAGLPFGDQGLLIPRALYTEAGGHPPLPLMEDMALARALRGRFARIEAVALTSADRYLRRGWLRQGAGNLWRQARFLAGADPARLARSYRP